MTTAKSIERKLPGYTLDIARLGDRQIGRQPEGWWIVAIDRERGTFCWAQDYQVQ